MLRKYKIHHEIKKIYTYKERKLIGTKLYYAVKSIGLNELSNLKWGTFYICKESNDSFNKNQRVQLKPSGIKSREITYIKSREIRLKFASMAKIIETNTLNQIGFASNKSIHDARIDETDIKKIWLIDLEKAFEQIKEDEILYVLNKVFTLRKDFAIALTKSMTRDGHLVQGHPMAPALFNIFTIPLINRLSKIVITKQYADDIIIYSKFEFIGHKFVKFIRKIFAEENWIINPQKFRFARKWTCVLGMYINFEGRHIQAKARKARNQLYKLRNMLSIVQQEEERAKIIGKFRWFAQYWDGLNLSRHLETMNCNKIGVRIGLKSLRNSSYNNNSTQNA